MKKEIALVPGCVFAFQNPIRERSWFRIRQHTPKWQIAENRSQVPYNRFLYRALIPLLMTSPPPIVVDSGAVYRRVLWTGIRNRAMIKNYCELGTSMGRHFSAFVPEEQPFPEIWEPEIPEPDDKGRVHMQALKHWQHLFPTRDFLRDRYAQYHILEGPSLRFDCLVPKFQKRMYYRVAEDQHGNPAAYSRQRHP